MFSFVYITLGSRVLLEVLPVIRRYGPIAVDSESVIK
jgi:hypothetical protein